MSAEKHSLAGDASDGSPAPSSRKGQAGGAGGPPTPREDESRPPAGDANGGHRKLSRSQTHTPVVPEGEPGKSSGQNFLSLDRNMKLQGRRSWLRGGSGGDKPPLRSSKKRSKCRDFFGLDSKRHFSEESSAARSCRSSLRLRKSSASKECLLTDDSSEGELSPCRLPARRFFRSTSCLISELHKGERGGGAAGGRRRLLAWRLLIRFLFLF